MPFVPPATTPRARELAKILGAAVETYRRENPRTTDHDVQRALQLATAKLGRPPKPLVLLLAGVALAGVLLALGLVLSRG